MEPLELPPIVEEEDCVEAFLDFLAWLHRVLRGFSKFFYKVL